MLIQGIQSMLGMGGTPLAGMGQPVPRKLRLLGIGCMLSIPIQCHVHIGNRANQGLTFAQHFVQPLLVGSAGQKLQAVAQALDPVAQTMLLVLTDLCEALAAQLNGLKPAADTGFDQMLGLGHTIQF